ncbi:MAG: hypothetical protein B6I28_04675, partial [Fusobacteriia bacterium 4572_132]
QASAGSGKTYSLVKEYLKMLLCKNVSFSEILAITFTNKAAEEMKERILSMLNDIKNGRADDFINQLTCVNKKNPEQKAEQKLNEILHNYSNFSIMTIDSFLYRIVRTFSKELGISPHSEVILDIEKIYSSFVDYFFDVLLTEDFYEALKKHLMQKLSEGKLSLDLKSDFEHYLKDIYETKKLNPESLKNFTLDMENVLNGELDRLKNELNEMVTSVLKMISDAGLKCNDFLQKGKSVAAKFERYKDGKTKILKFLTGMPFKKTLQEFNDSSHGSTKFIYKYNQSLCDDLNNIVYEYLKKGNHIKYLKLLEVKRVFYTFMIVAQIYEEFFKYKTMENVIFTSDFTEKLHDFIRKDDIGFIFWRLGERYNHIFIDEFQDTSKKQWETLFPLIEEANSTGKENFCFGDEKQSIYRWRGGDVEIMIDVGKNSTIKKLDSNYRSKKDIVEFNNNFFKEIDKTIGFSVSEKNYFDIYKNPEQKTVKQESGYVYCGKLKKLEDEKKKDMDNRIMEKIIKQLDDITNQGYDYSDIVFLVRSNSDGAKIAKSLFEKGIKVVSPDSLLLSESKEITFIISFLKYITTFKSFFLAELYFYITGEIYINDYENSYEKILNSFVASAPFNDKKDFFKFISYIKRLPLSDAIEEIIGKFKLNGKGNDIFLQYFLEIVLQHSNEGESIPDFIKFWDEEDIGERKSIVVPKMKGAVTVMTIHKAKGLEFPIVFLPFLNSWKINIQLNKETVYKEEEYDIQNKKYKLISKIKKELDKDKYDEENEKTWLDNINLLYVAFTRAIDRLYFWIEENEDKDKITNMSQLVKKVIDGKEELKKFIKENDENCYFEMGKKIKNSNSIQKEEEQKDSGFSFISNSWRNKIFITQKADKLWELEDSKQAESVQKGKKIHYILSKIDYKENIEKGVNELYLEGVITKDEIEGLKEDIEKLLALEKIGNFFDKSWEVKNEVSIFDSNDRENRRIDRLIISGKKAIVIDYKTGNEEGEHLKQVKNYMEICKEMGYETKGYLLYIKDDIDKSSLKEVK